MDLICRSFYTMAVEAIGIPAKCDSCMFASVILVE
jgi:hypothetical protein